MAKIIFSIYSLINWFTQLIVYRGIQGTFFILQRIIANNNLKSNLSKQWDDLWAIESISRETIYVFIFLGEFGYELLNWQGVVRKFSKYLPSSSEIICAGRKDLDLLYEKASSYINISEFPLFKKSIAAAYFALPPDQVSRGSPFTFREIFFDIKLRQQLKKYLIQKLNHPKRKIKFIFSSQVTRFPWCTFGVDRMYYAGDGLGKIYSSLDLDNNIYCQIRPDLSRKEEIVKKIDFKLEKPYVLIQLRKRLIGPKSGDKIPEDQLINELACHTQCIILDFRTGRMMDSSSYTNSMRGTMVYNTKSFRDQSCLIAFARKCIFFTEGDLGSHTYLPPLLGRDVYIIASKEVFSRPSAPIDFWNKKVFRFGGKMIPIVSETLFSSDKSFHNNVKKILFS